ncbi:hypothetical protein Tco_0815327 [Tanacetum coccineum]
MLSLNGYRTAILSASAPIESGYSAINETERKKKTSAFRIDRDLQLDSLLIPYWEELQAKTLLPISLSVISDDQDNSREIEESKAEDEANVEDTTYPGKEDGLDSLSFMAWVKAAPITFSEDMLIRRSQSQSLCSKKPPLGVVGEKPKSEKLSKPMAQRFSPPSSGVNTVCCAALITRSRGTLLGGLHDDSQSKVFYYAIFITSKTGLGGSWDEEKKQKVQGEMSSKELVKIRFFSTGHGVKLEGSMNYTNGKSWALLLSIYKWSRQRAPLVQKAASYKHYSKSSELSNKSKASRGRIQQDYRHGMPIKSVKGSLIKAGKQEDMTELMMDRISKGERLS